MSKIGLKRGTVEMLTVMADIFAELKTAQAHAADWNLLDLDTPQNIHIAVMSEPFLAYVFEGKKTIESRFSLNKIAPYQKVHRGDLVFMKAGPIVGCFTITWTENYDLTQFSIEEIQRQYGEAICGSDDFWKLKSEKRYATLMSITNVKRLAPTRIEKRDRRAWVAL